MCVNACACVRAYVPVPVCVCVCVSVSSVGHALMKSALALLLLLLLHFLANGITVQGKHFNFLGQWTRRASSNQKKLRGGGRGGAGPMGRRCPGKRNHAQRRIRSPRICLSKADTTSSGSSSKWTRLLHDVGCWRRLRLPV